MKRTFCALLALMLCLALSAASASPAVTLEELGDFEDVEMVYNGSLMTKRTDRGERLLKMDGTPVSEDYYADVEAENGYYEVILNAEEIGLNSSGLITEEGAEVMPFAYGNIEVLSPNWALGYVLKEATADNYDYTSWLKSDAYYLIDKVDIYNLNSLACVGSFPRANFMDADDINGFLNVEDRANGEVTTYDQAFNALGKVEYTFDDDFAPAEYETFRENGQEGVRDREGNIILKPSFYMIYDFDEGYAQVSTGDYEGLIDVKGNVVVPAEFDEVKRCYDLPFNPTYGSSYGYGAAGYFGVVQDGKLGFVKAGGEVTCEAKIADDVMDYNGASATYTDLGGDLHILAADGVDTVLPKYDSVYAGDYSAGRLYEVANEDYDKGLIDWHGEEVLPVDYDGVDFSSDGKYVLVDVDWGESKLFAIHYADEGAAPAAEAPAAAPAENAVHHAAAAKLGKLEAAPEAPAAEAPAASGENAAVITLVDSAITLLDTDGASANAVLKSALLLLKPDHAAVGMLNSAITLLDADPAANAGAAKLLLESAKSIL